MYTDDFMTKALLPPGCYDLLPPAASADTRVLWQLLSTFESFGYEEVAPPLLEYTDTLLAGRGGEFATQIFRVMDPEAQKVMGIRADMTLQVARIAASRLVASPRPMRLCYAGPILRVHGDSLREKRQFTQAGIELIGAQSPQADAEVIGVALHALAQTGIRSVTVDLNMPALVGALLADDALDPEEIASAMDAVAHKDAARLEAFPLRYKRELAGLLNSAGPALSALDAIHGLALPARARLLVDHMQKLVELLLPLHKGGVTLMLDAVESRAFQYHSGVSFSFFVPGASVEIGRGGHYRIDAQDKSEPATGFTFYADHLRHLAPQQPPRARVYAPEGINAASQQSLVDQGYVLIGGLGAEEHPQETARKLKCQYLFDKGELVAI